MTGLTEIDEVRECLFLLFDLVSCFGDFSNEIELGSFEPLDVLRKSFCESVYDNDDVVRLGVYCRFVCMVFAAELEGSYADLVRDYVEFGEVRCLVWFGDLNLFVRNDGLPGDEQTVLVRDILRTGLSGDFVCFQEEAQSFYEDYVLTLFEQLVLDAKRAK